MYFENLSLLLNFVLHNPIGMRKMKIALKSAGIILPAIVLFFVIWSGLNMRDRNPDYKAGLSISAGKVSSLKAGFSALTITPEVPDRWNDEDNNAKYEPRKGDTFTDGNGNGTFDPVWIAGFGNLRAANGVHDDLWARTMVLDDGKTKIAIVVLDAIGFMNDNVIDTRNRIPDESGITYTIIISTHTHEGPDMLGLWGKSPFKSGVDKDYIEFVKKRIVESVVTAADNMRPALLEISEDISGAAHLVTDTRKPEVYDSGLRLIKVVDACNGNTLGSVISWADHPETLWGKNLQITSDFPHYVREGVENGIFAGDSLVRKGIGGVSIYVNGAIGGLMTTHPSLKVTDQFSGTEYGEPSFQKAEAQGKQIALLALKTMENPVERIDSTSISLIARSVILPIKNNLFKLGTMLGILDRGMTGWMKMRSELAVLKIGPVSFATLPGEVYPEIVNGGIEAPEGNDFSISPVELPPVREMMPGKYKFIFGLANDETGYIIPKSQWDVKSPYTYGREDSPYGEENSLGPETAGILHRNLREMIGELKR